MSNVISFPELSSSPVNNQAPVLFGTAQLTQYMPSSFLVEKIESSFFELDTAALEATYGTALSFLNNLMDELFYKL